MGMRRERLEFETAYLRQIYACQAGLRCAGNCGGGWLGGPGGLFRTMPRVYDRVLLLGQRKARARVIPHRARIAHSGRRTEQLRRANNSVSLHSLHRQRLRRARHHDPRQRLAELDSELLELLEHVHHVLGQPARGDAQAPAPPVRVADFLHEDRLLGRALAQKAEAVRRGLGGRVDRHDRRPAQKGGGERAAGVGGAFPLGWRRRLGKEAVKVERILVVVAVRWR